MHLFFYPFVYLCPCLNYCSFMLYIEMKKNVASNFVVQVNLLRIYVHEKYNLNWDVVSFLA